MFDILSITIPIYVAIALGYSLTRWGIFPKSDMRAFGTFVVKVAMPALLFNALSQRSIKEILNPDYVMAYATGSILMLSLSIFWALRVGHHSRSMSSCLAMGMSCPNSGFVGYPIALLSFGSMAGVSLALNMMVENLLIIPIIFFGLLIIFIILRVSSNCFNNLLTSTTFNPEPFAILFLRCPLLIAGFVRS